MKVDGDCGVLFAVEGNQPHIVGRSCQISAIEKPESEEIIISNYFVERCSRLTSEGHSVNWQ